MPVKLDIDDPFKSATPEQKGVKLDIQDPFKAGESAQAAIPEPEKKGAIRSFMGGAIALPTGVVAGITHGVPAMAAEASEFVTGEVTKSLLGIGQKVKELVQPSPTYEEYKVGKEKVGAIAEQVSAIPREAKIYHREKEREMLAPSEKEGYIPGLMSQIGAMGTESLLPLGGVRAGAGLILKTGNILRKSMAAEKAAIRFAELGNETVALAKGKEAADLAVKYQMRVALSQQLGNTAPAALFGLSQAQNTIDNAKKQGVDPGVVPYITGAIEAFGEYYGTKYLTKLFQIEGGKALSLKVMDLLKSAGVEVSTEMLQNYFEAVAEKVSGIRPEAQPWEEAKGAIAPTLGLTLLTAGLAHGASRAQAWAEKTINREAAEKKSGTPTDIMKPPPPGGGTPTEVTPRAAEQPMTRTEKEYADWWNKTLLERDEYRQKVAPTPTGREGLAEQLAKEAGQEATVVSEEARIKKETEAIELEEKRKAHGIKPKQTYEEFVAEQASETKRIAAQEKAEAQEKVEKEKITLPEKAIKLKAAMAEGRAVKAQEEVAGTLKSVAQMATNKKFGEWVGKHISALNQKTEGNGEVWIQKLADKHGLDRESPNFISQLKRAVRVEAVAKEESTQEVIAKGWARDTKETMERLGTPAGESVQEVLAKGWAKETKETMKRLGDLETEEVMPKNQAIKLVNTSLEGKPSVNAMYDIFEGVHHIATAYGMDLDRAFQNLSDADTLNLTNQIQKVWKGVTGSQLFKDTGNKSQEIKDRIKETNKTIKEFSPTAKLKLEVTAEKRGRPKLKKEQIQKGETPQLAETKEETVAQIEDVADITSEPTDAELKEVEPVAKQMEQEIEKISEQVARAKRIKSFLQVYGRAKQMGIAVKGKNQEQLEADIQIMLDTAKEQELANVIEAINPGLEDSARSMQSLDSGMVNLSNGKEWQPFFDLHKPTEEQGFDKDLIDKIAVTNAADILHYNILIEKRLNPNYKYLALAEAIYAKWGNKLRGVKVTIINHPTESSAYDRAADEITINIGNKSVWGGKKILLNTILHENSHALSVYALTHIPEVRIEMERYMDKALQHAPQSVKTIIKETREFVEALGDKDVAMSTMGANFIKTNLERYSRFYSEKDITLAYSFANLKEFVANTFSSPLLRDHLKSIEATAKPALSLWKQMVRYLSQVLTGSSEYTMFEEVMEYAGENVFNSRINDPIIRKRFAERTQQMYNIEGELVEHIRDIKEISATNLDLRAWQKYIPHWTLGKFFKQAKDVMGSWMEGLRLLNRQLYQYEYDVDEKGKEVKKSFLDLSHPMKPVTVEQKLFDKVSVIGDEERKNMTRVDIEKANRDAGLNVSKEGIDKVEKAYESIREHYNSIWKWYWGNVRQVAMRIYEHRPWYPELVQVMTEHNTQISDEMQSALREKLGARSGIELRKLELARDSMLKAWAAIDKSEASMVKGYMPRMREQGGYRVNIKDTAGNILHTEFGINQASASMIKYRLMKEYPGKQAEAFYVSPSPENIFQEFDKKDLQSFVKSITAMMERQEEVSDEDIKSFYTALEAHIANKFKPTGFRTHQIQRVGQAGAAIKGYRESNVHEVYLAYIRNAAGSIRKMNFAFDANNTLRDVDIQAQGELFDYLKQYRDDMLRNEIASDKVISQVRSVAFLYYLAMNIKATAVNLTQNAILGIPLYARATGLPVAQAYAQAVKEMNKAMKDTMLAKLGQTKQFSAGELLILERAKRDGDTGAMQLSYMSGAMDRAFGSRYTYIVNLLGTPFSAAETVNREAALIAFYRLYRKQGFAEGQAYEKALNSTYDVHFPYGKYNYPEMVRAKGMLGGIGHLLSTFRSYTIMYVSTIFESFRGTDGKVSMKNCEVFFGSIAILMLLGGLTAPWLDDLMDVYERMSGNPIRSKIRDRLRKIGGNRLSQMGMHGIPSLLGIDITGSLKIGVPFIGSGGVEESITGVYSGLEQSMVKGKEAFDVGNYYRALEEWSPTFVRNAMKAHREYEKGATTVEGVPITDPQMKQYKPNLPEAGLQALGFRIGRRAELSEEGRTYENVKLAMAKEREKIYGRFRLAETDEERDKIYKRIEEYNKKTEQFEGGVPPITAQSIRRAVNEKIDKRRLLFYLLFNEDEGMDAMGEDTEE